MKKIFLALLVVLPLISHAVWWNPTTWSEKTPQTEQSPTLGLDSTLTRLDQWSSTSTPVTAITQKIWGTAIKITGVTTGQCLTLDANSLLTSTSCGGVGSGDPFPFTKQTYGVSTSTTVAFLQGFFSTASSTISNLQVGQSTTTKATTTSLAVTSISSKLLKTDTNGSVIGATAGSDYENVITFNTGLTRSVNTVTCDTGSASVFGCLATTDWTKFNNKISSSSLSATAPVTYSSVTGVIAIPAATASVDGYLSATNFQLFNNKVATSAVPTVGNLAYWTSNGTPSLLGTVATATLTATAPIALSQPISVIGGANSVLTCATATGSVPGCLSAADWTTFNSKGFGNSKFATSSNGLTLSPNGGNSIALVIGGNATTTNGTLFEVLGNIYTSGSTTLQNFTGVNATTSKATSTDFYSTKIGTNSEYFSDLTGTGLSNSAGVLTVSSVPNSALQNSSISFTSTDSSLSVPASIALGSSGAFTLNLANQNIWTGASTTFTGGMTIGTATTTKATTTNLFATTASTTNFFAQGLHPECNGTGFKVTYTTAGQFLCEVDQTSNSVDTINSKWASSTSPGYTALTSISPNAAVLVGIGTTTPMWALTISTSTRPQIALTDTTGTSNIWTMRSVGGNFYLATATPTTWATSTVPAFSINSNNNVGIGTTTAGTNHFYVESSSDLTNSFFTGDVNNYMEINIQNRNTGNNASGCLTLTNNLGTATTYYGELCINGSGYSQASFSSQNKGDLSLNANDGAVVIGTASTTNPFADIRFTRGGTASSSIIADFTQTGNGIGTTTPRWAWQIATTSKPQLTLSDSGNIASNHWSARNSNGTFYLATSSPLTWATSTSYAFAIDTNGVFISNKEAGGELAGSFLEQRATTGNGIGAEFIKFTGGNNGATEFARFTQSGFGVGTTTPKWALTISSSTRPQLAFQDGGTNGTNIWTMRNAGGNFYIGTSSPLTWATSTFSALTFINGATSTAGYIGIGTTTPVTPLTVAGAIFSPEYTSATTTNMTIDFENGTSQLIRMHTAALNVSLNRIYPGGALRLSVCNSASTAGAITFHSSTTILWTGGAIPTQTTTANKCDLWSFTGTNATTGPVIFGAMTPSF